MRRQGRAKAVEQGRPADRIAGDSECTDELS